MKILVRPSAAPHDEIDVTGRLVAAIAEELWKLYGGNDRLNWLEAELHLQRIVGQTKEEAEIFEILSEDGILGSEGLEATGRWSPAKEDPRSEREGQREFPARAPRKVRLRVGRSKCVRVKTSGVALGVA